MTSRKVGNVRLVQADVSSPYYTGLAEVLTRAFGVPAVLADELADVHGISSALVFGSWAARHAGQSGVRPVGDIDVLVLGEPDRDDLYDAAARAERRLGRPVQITIRDDLGWRRDQGPSTTRSPAVRLWSLPYHPQTNELNDPTASTLSVPTRAAAASR